VDEVAKHLWHWAHPEGLEGSAPLQSASPTQTAKAAA